MQSRGKSKNYMISSQFDTTTRSVGETQKLGKKIGTLINYPFKLALIGDLGSGKTAFVQGLAAGLDIPANHYITSPTFTLINEYPGRLALFHVDLYRIETVDDLAEIGLDELLFDRAVIAIEWADKLDDDLTGDFLSVHFEIIDENCRKVTVIGYGQNGISLIQALDKS